VVHGIQHGQQRGRADRKCRRRDESRASESTELAWRGARDGVGARPLRRLVQTAIGGKPRTGELYNYVARFGSLMVIVTANPLVVPGKPVAAVDTKRAGELLSAGVSAVKA